MDSFEVEQEREQRAARVAVARTRLEDANQHLIGVGRDLLENDPDVERGMPPLDGAAAVRACERVDEAKKAFGEAIAEWTVPVVG